jgi:hypothetical protein
MLTSRQLSTLNTSFHLTIPQGDLPPELDRVAFSNSRAASFIEACLQHQDRRPTATELLADDFLRPNEVGVLYCSALHNALAPVASIVI